MTATKLLGRLANRLRRPASSNQSGGSNQPDSTNESGAFAVPAGGLGAGPHKPAVPQGLPLPTTDKTVLVLTRPGCHLCDEVEQVVAEICGEHGTSSQFVNVDTLEDKYRTAWSDYVPVVAVSGRPVAVWQLSKDQLINAISGKHSSLEVN